MKYMVHQLLQGIPNVIILHIRRRKHEYLYLPRNRSAAAERAQLPVVDVEADGAGEGDEQVAQVDEALYPLGEHQLFVLLLSRKQWFGVIAWV